MIRSIVVAALAVSLLVAGGAQAALQLEGQSGVFLNSLAYPLEEGKYEASSHYVDLDSAGTVSTYNIAAGLKHGVEVGYTRVASDVPGVSIQNILSGKYLLAAESKSRPAVTAWAIYRDLTDGDSSVDLGLTSTKILHLAGHTVIAELGVRSTRARAFGLFGFQADRELKFDGAVAVFVTPKLIVGTEFRQQTQSRAWRDIAVRYIANGSLNIDAGVANLGPGLDNQVAVALTKSW